MLRNFSATVCHHNSHNNLSHFFCLPEMSAQIASSRGALELGGNASAILNRKCSSNSSVYERNLKTVLE